MNSTYPNCHYCERPLTENERDPESGTFSSAHFACTVPSADGTFVVITATTVPSNVVTAREAYTTLRRAVAHAESLADANSPYNGNRFAVVSRDGAELHHLTAQQPSFVQGEGHTGAYIERRLSDEVVALLN